MRRNLQIITALTTFHIITGYLGTHSISIVGVAAFVWPPSGISLAALLLFGWRGISVAVIGNLIVNALTQNSAPAALLTSIGNVSEAAIAYFVLIRLVKFDLKMKSLRDALGLAFAACLGATVSAYSGVSILVEFGLLPKAEFSQTLLIWWLANVLGSITITPLILALTSSCRPRRASRVVEFGLLIFASFTFGLTVFSGWQSSTRYLVFPLVLWGAIRFGRRGASLVTWSILLAGILTLYYLRGSFDPRQLGHDLINFELLITMTALSGLLLALVMRESFEAVTKLKEARDTLEDRVRQRTQELESQDEILKEQSAILKSILKHIGEGVVVADKEGHFFVFNPAAEKILGLGPASIDPSQWTEHYGIFFEDQKTPVDVNSLPLIRALRGETVDRLVLFIKNSAIPHGVFIGVTATPIISDAGDLKGAVAVISDITRQRKEARSLRLLNVDLEQRVKDRTLELERSNNDLERFAYVASHDLKEPLRSITSFGAIIRDEYRDFLPKEGREYIDFMVDGASRMRALIDGLLAYSRINRTQTTALTPVDLNEVLRQVVGNLRTSISEAHATLEIGTFPKMRVERNEFEQIFQNLLSNAIKFRRDVSPLIRVNCLVSDTKVVVTVSDNGIGIEPVYFNRIFELFQRLHSEKIYPGSGIGLSICKKVVERHGGSISIESVVGEGTIFTIEFPASLVVVQKSV